MSKQLNKKRIQTFISYYKPHKKILFLDLSFALLSSLTLLIFPLVSGYATRIVLKEWSDETKKTLLIIGLVLLFLVAVRICCCVLYSWFGHLMGARMEGSMRNELFLHYEKQDFSFHSHENVGKLMTVLTNDLTAMTELFHHAPENVIMMFLQIVGAFLILSQIHLSLTLVLFSIYPILCFAAIKADRAMEKGYTQARNDLSDLNAGIEDTLTGIRTVKAYGNEAYELSRFQEKNNKYTKSMGNFFKVEAVFYEIVAGYPEILTLLVIFFGSLLVGKNSLDVSVLVTFLLYINCLCEPVKTLVMFLKLYEAGKVSFLRFMDMMERNPVVKESDHPVDISVSKGCIELNHVTFAYIDSTEPVLEDVSLKIESGESVAIAGASGIGKTTISTLIARFYDADEGTVSIDGVDIRDISFESLRRNIAVVQQEVMIFQGTILDNIRYGRWDASIEDIILAAQLANAEEFINRLQNGYDTVVGTNGITLSGGQRQRISLARAFLKNPPILILDEATSALDYESEVLVQESIERLMKNRTSVIIAHRLSTIRNVDRIIVLGNKKIAESGSHEELSRLDGEYTKLCRMGGMSS